MNGGVVFLIILLIAVVGGYGGWVAYGRIRASRLGLPPPSLNPFNRSAGAASSNYPGPAPAGIKGWVTAQITKFKNRNNRTAYGAYEESSGGYNSARGRGANNRLDPDEAWSARVGDEAYYEEQELGLHDPPNARTGLQSSNPYESHQYGAPSPGFAEPERGRSRTREYDERSDGGLGVRQNPFGDENASSLRGVSPRPLDQHVDTSYGGAHNAAQKKKKGSADNSPTESRRSVFHEEM